jgi:hypothetical protein
MNKLEETMKIAEFAEKELGFLLNDVELQSEKLMEIQKKAGKARIGLYKSDRIMSFIAKYNKSRLIISMLFFLFLLSVGIYFKLKT